MPNGRYTEIELSRAAVKLGDLHVKALTDILKEVDGSGIVQVKFKGNPTYYHYKCKDAHIGDWVAVYSPVSDKVEVLKVRGIGTRSNFNPANIHKEATLVQRGGFKFDPELSLDY